jgi:hypothetical protein
MKPPFYLIAVLTAFNLPAQSQVLGIFEQSAEELSEYGQQIAALELLLTRQQEGYEFVESSLAAISGITGTEFTLHQHYYSSLETPNPAITQSPELDEFSSFQSLISTDLTTAISRWQQSGCLTFNDRAYIGSTSAFITKTLFSQLSTSITLTSDNDFAMTDDQRAEKISQLHSQARSLYVFTQTFIDGVDLLILNRKN